MTAPKLRWHDAKQERPKESGYCNVWFANGHLATVNYSSKWDLFNQYDSAEVCDEDDIEFDDEVIYWSKPSPTDRVA